MTYEDGSLAKPRSQGRVGEDKVHMNVVSLLSLRRDPPPESSPTFSVQSRSSVGRLTVDLIGRSWSSISQDFLFASCGSLIPFTWANAQWVIHGFI